MRWFGRLARAREIAYVRRAGERRALPTFTAYLAPSRSGRSSVAVAIPKAVGIAVVRNRIRRRICGALETIEPDARRTHPLRIFFVVRPAAASAPYADLVRDVRAVLSPRS